LFCVLILRSVSNSTRKALWPDCTRSPEYTLAESGIVPT
jgi:hypothetical protein